MKEIDSMSKACISLKFCQMRFDCVLFLAMGHCCQALAKAQAKFAQRRQELQEAANSASKMMRLGGLDGGPSPVGLAFTRRITCV